MWPKLTRAFAALAFAAAVILALLPQSYVANNGQRVGCGITIAPRNPTPPPENNDECDAEHVRRGILVVVLLTSAAAGSLAYVVVRRRSRSASA